MHPSMGRSSIAEVYPENGVQEAVQCMGHPHGVQYLSLPCHFLLFGTVLYGFDFNPSCVAELCQFFPEPYSAKALGFFGIVVLKWVVVSRNSPDEYLLGGGLPGRARTGSMLSEASEPDGKGPGGRREDSMERWGRA